LVPIARRTDLVIARSPSKKKLQVYSVLPHQLEIRYLRKPKKEIKILGWHTPKNTKNASRSLDWAGWKGDFENHEHPAPF
jgi:hypothetical protein